MDTSAEYIVQPEKPLRNKWFFTQKTLVYNVINDRLVDKSTVLKPLS